MTRISGTARLAAVAAVSSLLLAACGSSSSSDTSPTASSTSGGADVAAATAALEPYLKAPTPFPVDAPLKSAPDQSWKFAQLQYGTPIGALVAQIVQGAADVAKVSMTTVKAKPTASDTQVAVDSIAAGKPVATLLPASEPSLFSSQLKNLIDGGSKVVSVGVMDPEKYAIGGSMFDQRMAVLNGQLMADWVVARLGANSKAVLYESPELSFSGVVKDGFSAELKKTCASCSVRFQTISATTFGTTSSKAVVSDLQANPDTTVAVFVTTDAINGLPPAMKVAGLTTPIIGFGADPVTLQYVKDGSVAAMLAFDAAVTEWTGMDIAFRLLQGLPLTDLEKAGIPPIQMLEKATVPADISHGFSAYPDFVQRFSTLWKLS